MRRKVLPLALLVLCGGLMCGCGSAVVPKPPKDPTPAPPRAFRLDGPIDVSLAKLLATPRKELADLADEWAEKIRLQEKKFRAGELPFHLMPDFRVPLAVPVFRQARFSPRLGVSVPPYLDEDKKDNDVALHLARFGDAEAALKIADLREPGVGKRIEEYRYGRNYPVEWTRLVALQLHVAQFRLASGDEEGGQLLVGLHKQLGELLEARARASLLGTTLLPRGRGALNQAAGAWRKSNKADLADQAEKILAGWGDIPEFITPVKLGSKRAEIARLLGSQGKGHAFPAPDTVQALDLFALPFPEEGVESVLACFNDADQLAEVVIVYRPSVATLYPEPVQLGRLVDERTLGGVILGMPGGNRCRAYPFGPFTCVVAVIPDHSATGAVVRLSQRQNGPQPDLPSLARKLGPINFDSSFEQNRLRIAPDQRGLKVTADKEGLKGFAGVLPGLRLTGATLERDPDRDVVSRLKLAYQTDRHGAPALVQTALPFWEMGGPAQLTGADENGTRYLALVWKDARTRYTLKLAFGRQTTALFEVSDRTPTAEATRRAEQIAAQERTDRKVRLETGAALKRIERSRERVELGRSEDEVVKHLPKGKGIIRRTIPGGLAVVYNLVPSESAGYMPRELFVRFADKRVAEIRVRYTDHPDQKSGTGLDKLLDEIRAECGAAAKSPGSWDKVWTDYPKREPAPVLSRWQDDVTILTCQRDSEGIELVLLDRPLKYENGIPLDAFRCLPDGPKDCALAVAKKKLLGLWKKTRPEYQDKVLILTPSSGPYSQLQVSFDDKEERVVQIRALHRKKWDADPGAEALAQAVQDAWSDEIDNLGWWRRVDVNERKELQTWTTHDDQVRVSIFWQELGSEPRLFTEWKQVPAARK